MPDSTAERDAQPLRVNWQPIFIGLRPLPDFGKVSVEFARLPVREEHDDFRLGVGVEAVVGEARREP